MEVSQVMGVSLSHLFILGFSIINQPFWGMYPHLWKPAYIISMVADPTTGKGSTTTTTTTATTAITTTTTATTTITTTLNYTTLHELHCNTQQIQLQLDYITQPYTTLY